MQFFCFFLASLGASMREKQSHQAAEGWVALLAAEFEFLAVKSFIVMATGSLDAKVLWGIGLDDDFATQDATSGSPSHLCQQLESAFAGAEIRQVQCDICCNDTYQRHQRQIETLGDHLRADKHISLVADKLGEDFFMRIFAPCYVSIPAQDTRFGEEFVYQLFYFLRANAKEPDAFAATLWTYGWCRALKVAVMAEQGIAVGVVGQCHIAAPALDDIATIAAHDEGSSTATV